MIPISLLRKKKGFSHLKTQSFLSYHQILYVVLIVFDKPRTLTIKYHVYGLLSCFSHIQLFTTLWLYGLYGLQLACFSHIQLFTTLWLYGLLDYSSPGSSVHGILQAIILEWVAMPPPGIKPTSPVCLLHWQVVSLPLAPPGKPIKYCIFTQMK